MDERRRLSEDNVRPSNGDDMTQHGAGPRPTIDRSRVLCWRWRAEMSFPWRQNLEFCRELWRSGRWGGVEVVVVVLVYYNSARSVPIGSSFYSRPTTIPRRSSVSLLSQSPACSPCKYGSIHSERLTWLTLVFKLSLIAFACNLNLIHTVLVMSYSYLLKADTALSQNY